MTPTKTDTAVRYFIAIPGDPQASGIFGLGLSEESAVADAYAQSGTTVPVVSQDEDDDTTWHVRTTTHDRSFSNEGDAWKYAAERGFIARRCTERLYRHIEAYGCDASSFGWNTDDAGLDDLAFDSEHLHAAVAEVEEGLLGNTSQDEWTVEDALETADSLVDFYVTDDENVDESLREALNQGTSLRTAVNLAVRDIVLETISERAAS